MGRKLLDEIVAYLEHFSKRKLHVTFNREETFHKNLCAKLKRLRNTDMGYLPVDDITRILDELNKIINKRMGHIQFHSEHYETVQTCLVRKRKVKQMHETVVLEQESVFQFVSRKLNDMKRIYEDKKLEKHKTRCRERYKKDIVHGLWNGIESDEENDHDTFQ